LKAEFKDASATLGTKLLPVATKVVHALSDALQPGSKFRDVLGDLGKKAADFADDAKPIFTWIGDHPDLFTQIAKDAAILGGALKAKSFLTGLGLLKGAGGARLGGGALGGTVATMARPVPVLVTNPGFGRGGPGGIVTGAATAGATTAEKVGVGALLARASAGGAGGILSLLLTSGDTAMGDPGKQRRAVGAKLSGLLGDKTANKVPEGLWSQAIGSTGKFGDKWKSMPNALAQYQILDQYGNASDPKVAQMLATLKGSPGVPSYMQGQRVTQRYNGRNPGNTADHFLDDPKHSRTVQNIRQTNNIYVTTTDPNKVLAEAHKHARIAALGPVSTAATRDRAM
jgi:hypothetical protein